MSKIQEALDSYAELIDNFRHLMVEQYAYELDKEIQQARKELYVLQEYKQMYLDLCE